MQLIPSRVSKLPVGFPDRGDPIRNALFSEGDEDFIDFIEVSKTFFLLKMPLFVLEMPNDRP